MSMTAVIRKLYAGATGVATVGLLLVGGVAGKEYTQPLSEYFTHYGNVTSSEIYNYPDSVDVLSFGMIAPGVEVSIADTLWCVSADSISRQWVLIGTQHTQLTATDHQMNALPETIQAFPITSEHDVSDLGVASRHKFHDMKQDGYPLTSWILGDMRPNTASSCYIESTISAHSELFDIPKSITFKSIEFSYLYPGV